MGQPAFAQTDRLNQHACTVGDGDAHPAGFKRLRQDPELSSLKIIMVTTETELSQMASALDAGANEYVMKPFTKDILKEKLELVGVTA